MLALADAADKENRMASPASALPPLTTPKPKGKPKHKKSTNKQRITADAWKADKVVQRMTKEPMDFDSRLEGEPSRTHSTHPNLHHASSATQLIPPARRTVS